MVAPAPLPRLEREKSCQQSPKGSARQLWPLHKPTVPHATSKVAQPVFDAGVMTADLSASSEAEEAGQLPRCMHADAGQAPS
jgi:hypothetical protein